MPKRLATPSPPHHPSARKSTQSWLQTVEVTNKNLAQGYAQDIGEVQGSITTRTLLPGRTIMVGRLRQPYSVKRGDKILLGLRIMQASGITAAGTPLADGTTGALIPGAQHRYWRNLPGRPAFYRSVPVVQK